MKGIGAVTLFVEDLEAATRFYRDALRLPVVFQDQNSTAFKLGGTIVNLLDVREAAELIAPATAGGAEGGPRFQLTIDVDDTDATAAELQDRGVVFLNGPLDRPWGVRTAAFKDPSGHVWELAQPIP